MNIDRLDHIVLTVADIDRTCQFYQRALGFRIVTFGGNRKALVFGRQKINLHETGHEFEPKALKPTAGSGDLCFIATTRLETVIDELRAKGIAIEDGPVERTGALGMIRSVYIRDPDQNLLEISNILNERRERLERHESEPGGGRSETTAGARCGVPLGLDCASSREFEAREFEGV